VLFPEDTAPAQTDTVEDDDDPKDNDPVLALADFDYQYHQWSQTHIVVRSQGLSQDSSTASAPEQPTSLPPRTTTTAAPEPTTPQPPSPSAHEENTSPSKIACHIAKAKAKPVASAGILSSQSASQRRAALKGKHRKPSVETPPAPAPAPEPPKRNQFELMLDNSPAGRQQALALAVQQGIIDPSNDGQVAKLMNKIEESFSKKKNFGGDAAAMAAMVQKGGAVLGVVREDEVGEGQD
jgi:hypothetical protein